MPEAFFETWIFDGVRYIAVYDGNKVNICDQNGFNYGGWHSIHNFRKEQQSKSPMATPIGTIKALQFRV